MKKQCNKCFKFKSFDKFSYHPTSKYNLRPECNICRGIINKKYQINNKKKNKIYSNNYYQINKEKILKNAKKYYIENKTYIDERNKKWSLNNKDKRRKYFQEKRKNDLHYRILCSLRTRVNIAIRKNYKSLSTILLIGCEIDYLMFHIQNQFTKDMNWDNYGKWHIDHKKPCASFDLSKPSEQQKCFNYTNLQPLWAIDNRRKSNKIL